VHHSMVFPHLCHPEHPSSAGMGHIQDPQQLRHVLRQLLRARYLHPSLNIECAVSQGSLHVHLQRLSCGHIQVACVFKVGRRRASGWAAIGEPMDHCIKGGGKAGTRRMSPAVLRLVCRTAMCAACVSVLGCISRDITSTMDSSLRGGSELSAVLVRYYYAHHTWPTTADELRSVSAGLGETETIDWTRYEDMDLASSSNRGMYFTQPYTTGWGWMMLWKGAGSTRTACSTSR